MKLADALEISMDGPFGVGYAYARTPRIEIRGEPLRIVVSTDMIAGHCVFWNAYIRNWHFGLLAPSTTANWQPLHDDHTIEQVKQAYDNSQNYNR